MSLRARAIYIVILEIGLILMAIGIYPVAIKELTGGGEDALSLAMVVLGLAVGIVGCAVVLFKIAQGTAKPVIGFGGAAQTELTVLSLIKKYPVFSVPALFTTVLPFVFGAAIILLPRWMHILPVDILDSVGAHIGSVGAVLLFIFGIIFVIVLLQVLGFLITGELLQKRLVQGPHNFFTHMLKNVVIALPYVLLYSLVFLFVALASKRDSKRSSFEEAARSASIVAGLQILKYYIYTNLSSLAFEDRYTYTTLKDSAQYIRSNASSLFSVFTNSAVLSGVVVLYAFALMVWADRIPFLNEHAAMGLAFGLLAVLVAWIAFVQQVLFLLNYIRIRHPECDVQDLLDGKHVDLVPLRAPTPAPLQTEAPPTTTRIISIPLLIAIVCGACIMVVYLFAGEYRKDAAMPTPVFTTVTLPESQDVRPGEEVEIASITVINSTELPVDLIAFWYKKSGTATDAAIEMVYVEDGDGTFGTGHMYNLESPYYSRDGMVFIDQPEMFLVGPNQSRTYRILIEVSDEARTQVGKTIGLDFAGFSYDPQPSGMPASGAVHTIQY